MKYKEKTEKYNFFKNKNKNYFLKNTYKLITKNFFNCLIRESLRIKKI